MPGLEGTFLGRYSLTRRLGKGGMAEVYLATDTKIQREVAIKVVNSREVEFAERFDREAQAMGKLRHDHILPVYDYDEQGTWHYLVMPYIEHGTLNDLLKTGPLSPTHAGELLAQMASGLDYAHQQGLLHRDIKPSNILLRDDHYAYLADFGLARTLEGPGDLTRTGILLGTPEYMAPELADGPATISSDVYSLAVVLYHMLCGRVPFRGETAVAIFWKQVGEQPPLPSSFNHALAPALEQVVIRALEKDPSHRYPNAPALSQAYQDALTSIRNTPASPKAATYEQQLAAPPRPTPPVALPPLSEKASRPQPVSPQNTRQAATSRPAVHTFEQTTEIIPPAQQMPPPQNQRPRSKRALAGVLIGLIFLLLMSGLVAFLTIEGGQQNNAAGTVTAQTNATSTARASQTQQASSTQQANSSATAGASTATAATAIAATATAQAQATHAATLATATAQTSAASATATAITGSKPVLTDPLSVQDSNNWTTNANCQFLNNLFYEITVSHASSSQTCLAQNTSFQDAAIQVNVTLNPQAAATDSAGIVFRASNANTFYDFEITAHGQFFFRALSNGTATTLIPTTTASAILTAGNSNTLLVIAQGDDFRFFVNNTFVGETHDTAHASSFTGGQIGLTLSAASPTSSKADFDTLNVYTA
jgi:serine/threonine protein kinase